MPEMSLAWLTNTKLRVKYLHLLDVGGAFIDVHCAVKILHILENIHNTVGFVLGGSYVTPPHPRPCPGLVSLALTGPRGCHLRSNRGVWVCAC